MSEALRKGLLEGRKYTKASETDVAATFRRIRREMKAAEAVKQVATVRPIRAVKKST